MAETTLTEFIVALFSMMNPVGNVCIFAGMTADRNASEAKMIAWKCAAPLRHHAVDCHLDRRRIAGIFRPQRGSVQGSRRHHRPADRAAHAVQQERTQDERSRFGRRQGPGLYCRGPAGHSTRCSPGTMATVLVAAQRHPGVMAKVEISIVAAVHCVLTGLLFAYSKKIANLLGESGMAVVTRVMGMVLVAIAMGMLVDGFKSMIPALSK